MLVDVFQCIGSCFVIASLGMKSRRISFYAPMGTSFLGIVFTNHLLCNTKYYVVEFYGSTDIIIDQIARIIRKPITSSSVHGLK